MGDFSRKDPSGAADSPVLQALRDAETGLVRAQEALTGRQRFETGWRIENALTDVRGAIYSVTHPMPDSFYEGMETSITNPSHTDQRQTAARRAAFLLSQAPGAEVQFAVPAAPSPGDDAFVFLDGFQGDLVDDDDPEEAGAAFLLFVDEENLDPLFPEDFDEELGLRVPARTVEAVTAALQGVAELLGRADLTFVHNPDLPDAVKLSHRNRAAHPTTVCEMP